MRHPEDGYATPAAALISLAIAVVTAALVGRAVSELRLARAEFSRMSVEYDLASAHQLALLSIASSSNPPPYRWTLANNGQVFTVIAEPERDKLSPQAGVEIDAARLARFGVADDNAVRASLQAMIGRKALIWPGDAATIPAWRACAASAISPFGLASAISPLTYSEPDAGKTDSTWRAGEAWRVVVTDAGGWRDERIVRFTGDGLRPAAVIGRHVSRGWKEILKCELLLNDADT